MKQAAFLSKAFFVQALMLGAGLANERGGMDFQGYWKGTDQEIGYEKFLRIDGNRGFYCVMDGKSSFAFEMKDGSITTPFNGRDKIERTVDADHLRISGEEKGEPYFVDFEKMSPAEYPDGCREEETVKAGTTTGMLRALTPRKGFHPGRKQVDILGRTVVSRRAEANK
jgi:hypothetical protein